MGHTYLDTLETNRRENSAESGEEDFKNQGDKKEKWRVVRTMGEDYSLKYHQQTSSKPMNDNAAGALLDDFIQENSTLAETSPKHSVWDRKKRDADRIAGIYAVAPDSSMRKHADAILDCSEVLYLSKLEQQWKASSVKCKKRHCPICQSARSIKFRERFTAAIPKITAALPNPRFILLTLTVKNCPIEQLRKTISEINAAYYRMFRRVSIVKGWVRGTEVTRGPGGSAHPHFHAVLVVPSTYFGGKAYITQARWSEMWQEALGVAYTPIVDVRTCKTMVGGVEEAVKAATYSTKPSDIEDDPAWFHELHRQVTGLRFLATGGIIKTALGKLDDEPADDLVEGEGRPEASSKIPFDFRRDEPIHQYRKM